MSNATLTSLPGYLAKDADMTITINRSDLKDVMIGKAKLVGARQRWTATLRYSSSLFRLLSRLPLVRVTQTTVEQQPVKKKIFKDGVPVGSTTLRPN
jgi:hypothetical protein